MTYHFNVCEFCEVGDVTFNCIKCGAELCAACITSDYECPDCEEGINPLDDV